ncbi:MAG: M20/M25/M40 family metallo-hydrolase [Bryobacteraceae bacterium]
MKQFGYLLFAAALAAQSPDMARVRTDLAHLTAAGMHGRAALEPGHDAAAKYVEQGFRDAGLAITVQEFNLFRAFPDAGASSVAWNGRAIEYRGSFRRDVDAEAPVVFAGYGITAPEYGYDDYAGLDVKGKIVIVLDREPGEPDRKSPFLGRGLTVHSASRIKRLNAQRRGALALLTVSSAHSQAAPGDPNPARGSAHTMHDAIVEIPQLSLPAESIAVIAPSYREWQNTIDRTYRPASRTIDGTMRIRLVNREVTAGKGRNVIGVLEGTNQTRKDEPVLITSHYDHLPDKGSHSYPGANDNASGTVAVMELARQFAARGKLERPLVFISFGAEENGLLGSYWYAAHPLVPLAKTLAVLNLDMVARDEAHTIQTRGRLKLRSKTSDVINLVGVAYSPDLAELLRRANKATRLRLDEKFDHESSQNTLWRCDHFPFLVEGVPAVWLFGGWHPGYHEPVDTMDRLNYTKLGMVIELTAEAARILASGGGRPQFRSMNERSK